MLAKLFRKHPSTEEKINTEIERILSNHKKLVNRIDNLLPSYKDVSYKMFYNAVRRFIRKVHDLPASENHHHSERFGLVAHSLETVVHALTKQHRTLELRFDKRGDLDSQFNMRNRERILYRTAIQALLHDAGKVFDMEIFLSDKDVFFDPYEDNLLDFSMQHGGDYELRWLENRTGKHSRRNIIILFQILENEDRKYLSAVNFLKLIDEFFGYDPNETMTELLKEADVKSVQSSFSDSGTENSSDEGIDLIDAFTSSISEMTDKRLLRVNVIGGDIIVTDTTTLVLNPGSMEQVLTYMQKHHSLKTSREHMVNIMRDKKVILETDTGKTYTHAEVKYKPEQKKPFRLNFVIIKNKYLWGCNKPDSFTGEIIFPDFVSEDIQQKQSEPTKPEPEQDSESKSPAQKPVLTSQEELMQFIEVQQPKKFTLFLRALSLALGSEKDMDSVEEVLIDGQAFIAIGYPDGFHQIAEATGLYDVKSADSRKALHGFLNSLHDSNHTAKLKEHGEKPLVPVQGKKSYEKAMLIFKDSVQGV